MKKMLIARTAATLTLAAGTVAGLAGPAAAAPSSGLSMSKPAGVSPAALVGYVKNRHSGKCIDVQGASAANNAAVIQWSCNGRSNQHWQTP